MNNRERNVQLGAFIRTRRKARELSISQAAEAADMHHSYWARLEKGEYQTPNPRMLPAIAEVLGCSLEDLYAAAGYTPTAELPSFTPYLRSRYPGLPSEAIADLERWFDLQRAYYDIPDDQPVYPPIPKEPRSSQARKPSHGSRNGSSHPWRGAA